MWRLLVAEKGRQGEWVEGKQEGKQEGRRKKMDGWKGKKREMKKGGKERKM
jgi:hypothetical protein